jgi:hypothetical protein
MTNAAARRSPSARRPAFARTARGALVAVFVALGFASCAQTPPPVVETTGEARVTPQVNPIYLGWLEVNQIVDPGVQVPINFYYVKPNQRISLVVKGVSLPDPAPFNCLRALWSARTDWSVFDGDPVGRPSVGCRASFAFSEPGPYRITVNYSFTSTAGDQQRRWDMQVWVRP